MTWRVRRCPSAVYSVLYGCSPHLPYTRRTGKYTCLPRAQRLYNTLPIPCATDAPPCQPDHAAPQRYAYHLPYRATCYPAITPTAHTSLSASLRWITAYTLARYCARTRHVLVTGLRRGYRLPSHFTGCCPTFGTWRCAGNPRFTLPAGSRRGCGYAACACVFNDKTRLRAGGAAAARRPPATPLPPTHLPHRSFCAAASRTTRCCLPSACPLLPTFCVYILLLFGWFDGR